MNNKSGEVSAKTRERVLSAMQRLGYRPNAAARAMVGKRMNTIGIADRYTHSPVDDPYKTQILEPIIHTARGSRWDVLYYSGHPNEEQAGSFAGFLDGRSDGLICFTGNIEAAEVAAILRTGLPVVFIGETQGDQSEQQGAVIDVDNETGAYLGVSHLLALGHTRIAMMTGATISGNFNRVAGYRRALAERGVSVDPALLYPTVVWEGAGYAQGIATLSLPVSERPTAVFCFNDMLALGLLRAARDLNVKCPEQLSIVGFDDVFPAATASTPLTTVRQPLSKIGARAVEMLIAIIEGRLPRQHCELLPPELVVRASTAPPLS